jgi:hypothetical protein
MTHVAAPASTTLTTVALPVVWKHLRGKFGNIGWTVRIFIPHTTVGGMGEYEVKYKLMVYMVLNNIYFNE